RSAFARMVIACLCVALVATVLFSLAFGASDASVLSVVKSLIAGSDITDNALSVRDRIIIYDIRLPRVILGALIGASLAVSGAVMQGLFRNPLADPGIVGVSAGAGLGAVSIIVLGGTVLAPVIGLVSLYALPGAAVV
ncbi:iron chelate uptake ABC transporter family permease subunit, partial [Enterobacter hormaechei]|nr:iron chelate uptake ABC transporter family permease subunit [Enterobacter hormaechei]